MSDLTVVSDAAAGEELIYTTVRVSKLLGVNEKTLRRYCSLMQNHHYEFHKNKSGHRLFYKKDIEMIKRIIDLKNSGALTLEQSVRTVLGLDAEAGNGKSERESTLSKFNYNELLEEFTTFKNEQLEFNKLLIEQLQRQETYIRDSMEGRDNKLMIAMKESMETRRQLAAAVEAEQEKEKEKKVWWQFWK
ncbi:MAG TPA: MerR family transcriptional regulator [Ureibacillus sp.]|nr:MerR family transcriptional regulator [Ureibacillus sp.]